MKQISTGHCNAHQITVARYKELFPTAPLVSENWREQKKASSKKWADEHKEIASQRAKKGWENSRENYLKGFKTRPPQTEEKKKQISETMKKVYAETNFPLKELHKTQSEDYKTGKRINPFTKTIGRNGSVLSSGEQAAKDFLAPFNFQHNYPIKSDRSFMYNFYIDFALPELKIAIEINDKDLHSRPERIECDARKQLALSENDWTLYIVEYDSSRPKPVKTKVVTDQLIAIIEKLNLQPVKAQ